MSSAKFASITASLLARKGDAAPSVATLPARPSAFGDEKQPFPPPPPREFPPEIAPLAAAGPRMVQPCASQTALPQTATDHGDKPRRIVVTLSNDEFERLCIAAIKRDTSRHNVVHAALEQYFQQLAAELPRRCACMAEGGCCG